MFSTYLANCKARRFDPFAESENKDIYSVVSQAYSHTVSRIETGIFGEISGPARYYIF